MEETKRAKFLVSGYATRNANEPSKASLVEFAVVNLPEMAKPATYHQATANSGDMAARSTMGWGA